jgi:hypothetical protein
MYVILAKSLATGQGYRYLNLPGTPVASHFPPGYPLVLSVLWRIMPSPGSSIFAFKVLNALLFGIVAVLIAQLVWERLQNAAMAVLVGILTAISIPLLVLSSMVLSEMLFLALTLYALIRAERVANTRSGVPAAAVVGALIGVCMLVRSHGVVLLPAALIPLLAQRRWRESGVLALCTVVVIAPWQVWSATHATILPAPLAGNYGSYTSWWARGYSATGWTMIPATLERTVSEAGGMFSALFTPRTGEYRHWHLLTRYLLLAGAIVGSFLLAQRAPVTLGFLSLYAAMVAIWPFPPSRFIWGVWPLVLFVLVSGAYAIVALDWRRVPRLRYGVALAYLWLAIGYARYEIRGINGKWWSSISRYADPRIASAVEWTRANAATNEILACEDEGALYLYTNRQTVPVASFTTGHYLLELTPQQEAVEGLLPIIRTWPIRSVLVGSPRSFAIAQFLSSGTVPYLALRQQFTDGAAFTVLHR